MAYDCVSPTKLVSDADALKVWERTFILCPERWRGVKKQIGLKWQRVQFKAANRGSVPRQRGLYAFIVQHLESFFPPHGYIMYIGVTGNASKDRNLRVRYGEYLDEARKGGRSKVVHLLTKWKDDTYFHFAEIPDATQDLFAIEKELLTAVVPPCNESFSAEVAPAIKVLR